MNGSTATAKQVEHDAPDVIEDLEPMRPWAMARVDPVAELAAFEAAVELQRKLLPASLKATLPEDWVDQGGKAYLQATGVERIAPLWGLLFGVPEVTRENNPDGSYTFVVVGAVASRRTGVIYRAVTGGRSSSDPFFDEFDEPKPREWGDMDQEARRAWKVAHRLTPDPIEVRKAAITNWTTRGASMLAGMRGLTVPYLESCGIKGIKRVEYGSGAKGGDTAPADVKAKRTALWNDILRRTGGEVDTAKSVLQEITKYDSYKNRSTGKDVQGFAGHTDHEKMTNEKAIEIAASKLKKHPMFGDDAKPQREPGEEG